MRTVETAGGQGRILPDSKTGPRAAPLGKAARTHIGALPGDHEPNRYLFPTHAGGQDTYSFATC